jgi:hypothetical protein
LSLNFKRAQPAPWSDVVRRDTCIQRRGRDHSGPTDTRAFPIGGNREQLRSRQRILQLRRAHRLRSHVSNRAFGA